MSDTPVQIPQVPFSLLMESIRRILHTISGGWQQYDTKMLTAVDCRSLHMLLSAGLVDLQLVRRYVLWREPIAAEVVYGHPGDLTETEMIQRIQDEVWPNWRTSWDAYAKEKGIVAVRAAISSTETGLAWIDPRRPGKLVDYNRREYVGPDEWKLTANGLWLKDALGDGDAKQLMGYVLDTLESSGEYFYDASGNPVWNAKPFSFRIGHVKKVHVDDPTAPMKVSIANWAEGAQELKKAVEPLIPKAADIPATNCAASTVSDDSGQETVPYKPRPNEHVSIKERLTVDVGKQIVTLDGRTIRVETEPEAELLSMLQEAYPGTVMGHALKEKLNIDPSRVIRKLPPDLQAIVIKPGAGKRTGYRLAD